MANAKLKNWNAHIALGYCPNCRQDLVSLRGGLFVRCRCEKSYIDQERFCGMYVRLGGEAQLVEQLCPKDCKIKEHRKNDKNNSTSKSKPNIKKKRQVSKTKLRNKRT